MVTVVVVVVLVGYRVLVMLRLLGLVVGVVRGCMRVRVCVAVFDKRAGARSSLVAMVAVVHAGADGCITSGHRLGAPMTPRGGQQKWASGTAAERVVVGDRMIIEIPCGQLEGCRGLEASMCWHARGLAGGVRMGGLAAV